MRVGGCHDRVGGVGELGYAGALPDRELLDALGPCGALVSEGPADRYLAENR